MTLTLYTCHTYTYICVIFWWYQLQYTSATWVLSSYPWEKLRICAEQTVSSQTRTLFALEPLAAGFLTHAVVFFFHTDLQAFSQRFSQNGFDLFTKGKLSSLAVHNGIPLRKSDEEESVSGLTIGRMRCCFLWPGGTWHTHTHTHNPYSLHICHSHAHIVPLLLLMNNRVRLLPVHLMLVTCVTF